MSRQLVIAALIAALAFACSRGDKKGPTVAKGNGVAVTTDEFKAKLEEQSPFIRARYNTLERKKEFLENMIRFELLASEAQAKKLDKDPEVQATLKKIMVQKLVRQAFDENDTSHASESDARKYYQDHPDEFVKPERVRVSQLFLKAEKGSAIRTRKAADAKKLYAKLKADEPKNPLAFANLARDLSEDFASKSGGGDLGYRTRDELAKQWGDAVAAAAFALKDMGQESGIVESTQGFHVLKLASRQPALNRSFDEVKAQLIARVARESRTKEFDAYVKNLREKANVKIDDAELEKIAVATAPSTAASTSMMAKGTPGVALQQHPPQPSSHR